jgi:hypothetical protein
MEKRLVEAELKKEEGEAIALNSIEGVSQTNVTLFLNFCIQYIFDLNAKFYFEDFNFSILYFIWIWIQSNPLPFEFHGRE